MKQQKIYQFRELTFDIPVDPSTVSMQSARHSVVAGKIHSYQKATKVQTKMELREWFSRHPEVKEKIDLATQQGAWVRIKKLAYVFPFPASLSGIQKQYMERHGKLHKNTKPDLADNLKKLLFDAMSGIVFYDDARICAENQVEKYYGGEPRIILALEIEWYE
ncbi:MAG TPA: RusA family crossover junction endodeoxyribonuclease [Candidatus Cloacimonadota bacterium]|nr:RusA family crossover junction endodeoxyribonuclease [Candidatus Cloacimonadota bacterium]HPS38365.1 RusA family crossover junction endodeoxyribonuclease [Candidatus Cloacimonadota bacterium]